MSGELYDILKLANRLPSPPGVALRVLELARSTDSSLADIAGAIGSDPALSARILRFVNSPVVGVREKISSLKQAVILIGLRGVKTIALSFSLISLDGRNACPLFEYERFWSRSLACAVTARTLAGVTRSADAEEAFMAGLLARIGQLVLASGIPDRYMDVLRMERSRGCGVFECELELLGTTHDRIGSRLLKDWHLPEHVCDAIGQYRSAHETQSDVVPLVRILRVSELAAEIISTENPAPSDTCEVVRLAESLFGMDAPTWVEHFERITRSWREYGELLTIPTSDVRSFSDILAEAREHMAELSLATQLENRSVQAHNEELLQLSKTDKLTAVGNRAAFDDRIAMELDRAQRTHRPLVLFLIDIDHFKRVNDAYGHQAGDRILQVVASALARTVRKIDYIARYGGEEFAVIAPECGPEGAASLADRLRTAVGRSVVDWEGQSLRVTASIGVAFAHWPDHARSIEALFAVADRQLYAAKRAGRNCWRLESAGAAAPAS